MKQHSHADKRLRHHSWPCICIAVAFTISAPLGGCARKESVASLGMAEDLFIPTLSPDSKIAFVSFSELQRFDRTSDFGVEFSKKSAVSLRPSAGRHMGGARSIRSCSI